MTKMLYEQDDGKFEEDYLRKLKKNFEGKIMLELKTRNLVILFFVFIFVFIILDLDKEV